MPSTANTASHTTAPRPAVTALVAALMLFSMFFGAGNLIFPPMVGVHSGTNFWPATLGFLAAGVALPVLAVIAVAISGRSVRDIGNHGGKLFGLVFSVMAYLAIGAFYALPRTGAVAMETAITPLLGWEGTAAAGAFNTVFFLVALALSWRPNNIIDTLGKFLTPALVALLVVLIILGATANPRMPGTPTEEYASGAFVAGLFQGYNTMDAIAGLAFSIVVVTSLKAKGFKKDSEVLRGTVLSVVIAGVLLAGIYLGLAWIGQTMPNGANYESGALLLADAAHLTMGELGQVVFSAIVLLACMTTAVGLISATSEFFQMLVPKVSYHAWACLFTAMSIAFAFQGLDAVLAIAVPFIIFLYPPAITLIAFTLLQPALARWVQFFWAFRLALWTSVVWSAATSLGAPLGFSPGQDQGIGWIMPTVAAFIVGLLIDAARRTK